MPRYERYGVNRQWTQARSDLVLRSTLMERYYQDHKTYARRDRAERLGASQYALRPLHHHDALRRTPRRARLSMDCKRYHGPWHRRLPLYARPRQSPGGTLALALVVVLFIGLGAAYTLERGVSGPVYDTDRQNVLNQT